MGEVTANPLLRLAGPLGDPAVWRGWACMPPSVSTGRGSSLRGLFQERPVTQGWRAGVSLAVLTPGTATLSFTVGSGCFTHPRPRVLGRVVSSCGAHRGMALPW